MSLDHSFTMWRGLSYGCRGAQVPDGALLHDEELPIGLLRNFSFAGNGTDWPAREAEGIPDSAGNTIAGRPWSAKASRRL